MRRLTKAGNESVLGTLFFCASLLAWVMILFALPAAASDGEDIMQELPSSFDSRQEGKTPTVKSQGRSRTCWAVTATSALESAFLPEERIIFSADHMSLNNGFVSETDDGGDYTMIMAYLSGWYGPVLESEDPYGDKETVEGLFAAAHVQDMMLLPDKDRETFKEMVYRYGCVQTSLYMSKKSCAQTRDYYNKDTFGYYCPDEFPRDHDVLIIGWDDDYPRENFKIAPMENGAFLCQNTWGEDFGDGGFFYVSYEDVNIAGNGLVYLGVYGSEHYDNIYQHDVCGWQGRGGFNSESCMFANVYTAEEDQVFMAAGFYTLGEENTCELYLVHDYKDSGSFGRMKKIGAGRIRGKGFFTIEADRPVALKKGERFAVIVDLTTRGVDMPVALEMAKDRYTANVTLEGKESYISLTGTGWQNVQETLKANVCLKAYTSDAK